MKKILLLAIVSVCCAASAMAQAFTPTPVTPPDGLTTTTMSANVTSESWNYTFDTEVQVGIVGNEMYIQGLTLDFPDAWIKGSIEGDDITFAQGQFIDYFGEEGYSYELYACGYTGGSSLCDFVLHRDAATGIMTGATGLGEFMEYEGYYYNLDRLSNIKIAPVEGGEGGEAVVVPDGLEWKEYNLSAEDLREGAVDYTAQLAFDGDDVYLTDFCQEALISGAAIKGYRADEETLVFPSEQFLERYDDGDETYDFYFYGATYDESTNLVTTGDFILDYDAASDTYHSRFTGILITLGQITSSEISFTEFLQNIVLFGNGEADGVTSVDRPVTSAKGFYTLDGRRMPSYLLAPTSSLNKGIIIKNGRVSFNR